MNKRVDLPELTAIERVISREIDDREKGKKVTLFREADSGPLESTASIKLHEDSQTASLTALEITGLHRETLVLKPDNFLIRHYKSGTRNKACDFLVLTQYGNEKYALFIDLKTTIHENPTQNNKFGFENPEDAKMVWQMIGADALFDSLIDVATKADVKYKRKASAAEFKKESSRSDLSKYRRGYIILYKEMHPHGIGTTGPALKTASDPQPTTNALERDVCAVRVMNQQSLALGDLIQWCA